MDRNKSNRYSNKRKWGGRGKKRKEKKKHQKKKEPTEDVGGKN